MDNSLDPIYNFLSHLFVFIVLFYKLDKVKDFVMEEKEYIFDLGCPPCQPWILCVVKFLADFLFEIFAIVVILALFFREQIFVNVVE